MGNACCTHQKRDPSATRAKRDSFEHDPKTYYPMYVMKISDFIAFDFHTERMPPHQDLTARGMVVAYDRGMTVIFLSHEWLGLSHADPQSQQLECAQTVFKRLVAGAVSVEAYWVYYLWNSKKDLPSRSGKDWPSFLVEAYIWFDWMSIPHMTAYAAPSTSSDLMDAVNSIPAYASLSRLMIILVPESIHADHETTHGFSTWQRRGWCITEYQTRLLSMAQREIMVVAAAEAPPFFVLPADAIKLNAGNGVFTCCQRNHVIDGELVHCDKIKVAKTLATMCDTRVEHTKNKGDLQESRCYRMLRSHILLGLPDSVDNKIDGVDAFMQAYEFQDVNENLGGWSPLRYAAMEGNTPVVKKLLEHKVDVDAPLHKQDSKHGFWKGQTILHTTMAFSTPTMVALLLDANADCTAKDVLGESPLFSACAFGKADNIQAWLSRFPAHVHHKNKYGAVGLITACLYHQVEAARALIRLRSDVNSIIHFGFNCLAVALIRPGVPLELVELLISSGADVNRIFQPTKVGPRAVLWFCRLSLRMQKSPTSFTKSMAHLPGSTVLHWAAANGDSQVVRTLLRARAVPHVKNCIGGTALEWAEYCGPFPRVKMMLQAEQIVEI